MALDATRRQQGVTEQSIVSAAPPQFDSLISVVMNEDWHLEYELFEDVPLSRCTERDSFSVSRSVFRGHEVICCSHCKRSTIRRLDAAHARDLPIGARTHFCLRFLINFLC